MARRKTGGIGWQMNNERSTLHPKYTVKVDPNLLRRIGTAPLRREGVRPSSHHNKYQEQSCCPHQINFRTEWITMLWDDGPKRLGD